MKDISLIKAKDIMQTEVICLSPDMTLFDAAKLLSESGISGAPVVDDLNEVVGVLSQSDLLKHSMESEYASCFQAAYYHDVPFSKEIKFYSGASMNSVMVKEIMSPYVITATPDDNISEIARSLKEHKFHRLIVTEGKKLSGLISTHDLLKVLEGIN